MVESSLILALAGPAQAEPSPLLSLAPVLLVFGIFYFVLILPMRNRQKKLEQVQKQLKAGDRVIVNPGILGTVVGVEEDALVVRIAEQTKIKVLRSAIAGLQGQGPETTEKK
jgi:preprotein translocase subunit YajC